MPLVPLEFFQAKASWGVTKDRVAVVQGYRQCLVIWKFNSPGRILKCPWARYWTSNCSWCDQCMYELQKQLLNALNVSVNILEELGCSKKSWKVLLGRRMSGLPYSSSCQHNPDTSSCDGWFTESFFYFYLQYLSLNMKGYILHHNRVRMT